MKMLSSTIVVGEQKMSFETHFFPKWERTKNYLRDSNEFKIDSLLGTKKMSLVRKVSTRLCFLRQLKKSHGYHKRASSILHHMHSLYSGVRQPSFSSRSNKLSKRRPRKTGSRYEDYLPWAIIC